jgi:WD40 repeat protein
MFLSPDGSTFITFEALPGITAQSPKRAVSLWDVKTGQFRSLPDNLNGLPVFSPDSQTLAVQVSNEKNRIVALNLFDVPTGREKLSIPITEPDAQRIGFMSFSPNSKVLVGQVRDEIKTGQHWLKFWDPATGRELASFEGARKEYFVWMAFSREGRTLAVTNTGGEQNRLFLFDVHVRKLVQTIVLGGKAAVCNLAFSPNGKWIVVTTQVFPEDRGGCAPEVEDVAQPRIHLVDVAEGVIRETLVAPQGFTAAACFSPDGNTLATGGHGKVLLWDLTVPPGSAGAEGKQP